MHGTHYLFESAKFALNMSHQWVPLPLSKCKFCTKYVTPVGPMHYSRDLQIFFFNKFLIKNGSYGTIYTFKNYFTTIFPVFSKISGIQTTIYRMFCFQTFGILLSLFILTPKPMTLVLPVAILIENSLLSNLNLKLLPCVTFIRVD